MSEKDINNNENQELDEQPDEIQDTDINNETPDEQPENSVDYEAILAEEKDKYLRLFAEYDNYRKRTSKEKTEAYGDSAAKTIAEILPALDNFERALDAETSDEKYKEGIVMIFNQLQDILRKLGVTEIEALNQPFDPNIHSAIKQVDDENFGENTVCQVFQKGYKLGDRIIRHSMVAVAN
jgi:molecular chaperone GrpE